MGAGDGTVDISGVKAEFNQSDNAAQGIVVIIESLISGIDQGAFDQKGYQGILVSFSV